MCFSISVHINKPFQIHLKRETKTHFSTKETMQFPVGVSSTVSKMARFFSF